MEKEHLILIPVVYNTHFFKKVDIEHYSIQPTKYKLCTKFYENILKGS